MEININWERKEGILIAALVGRVDAGNAEAFQNQLESGIDAGDDALILDCEQLSFISSAGLRVGLIIAKKFNKPGKEFGMCALSGPVREVIAISGFNQLISIYDSREEAINAITRGARSKDNEGELTREEEVEKMKNEKVLTLARSVDLDILGDNIQNIADFTIEKYEFRNNGTLSSEIREQAVARIKDELWKEVEQLKQWRRRILERMFDTATKTLDEIVDKK